MRNQSATGRSSEPSEGGATARVATISAAQLRISRLATGLVIDRQRMDLAR